MRRTANDRPVVALLGLILGLGLLLLGGASGPAHSQALVQGVDEILAPAAFAVGDGPAVPSTRTLLDVPPGETSIVYSTTIQVLFDFTDLAVRWETVLSPTATLTATGPGPIVTLPPAASPTTRPALSATATRTAPAALTDTPTVAPAASPTLTGTVVPVASPTLTGTTALRIMALAQVTDTATLPPAPAAPENATATASPATSAPASATPTTAATEPISATATLTAATSPTVEVVPATLAPGAVTPPAAPGPLTATIAIEVRTSADGKTWGAWQPVPPDSIVDPAAPPTVTFSSLISVPQGGPAARRAQLRVSLTRAPNQPAPQIAGLTVSFINGGDAPDPYNAIPKTGNGPLLPSAPPPQPVIIPRTAWGSPDGEGSPAWPPQYRRPQHLILDHLGAGNDSDTNFAARVRALWYYHAKVRGWGDIGYNYIMGAGVAIYEGRAGGKSVIGRHSYPFDAGSIGIGLLGKMPSPENGVLQGLLDWLLVRNRISAVAAEPFTGALACGDTVVLTQPAIAGQSDYAGTGCGQAFNRVPPALALPAGFLPALRPNLTAALPDYNALFLAHTTPAQMPAGVMITTSVTVQNAGKLLWAADLPEPVHLGYHWFNTDGTPLEGGWSDYRNPLPRDMGYGDAAILRAQVSTPITPGTYLLRWDMVHELHTWFGDFTLPGGDHTSLPLPVTVTVTLSDSTPPTTQILGVLPITGQARFPVAWLGTDAKGGITGYDVQYRYMPQGPWIDWQTGVTTNEAQFDGSDGYTYAFRARATDTAGNVAPWPDEPQALVTVDLGVPQLTVITPMQGLLVPPGPLLVRGISDPSALVQVNGLPALVLSGTFTATVPVTAGEVPLRVVATDAAGNTTERDVLVVAGSPLADVPDSALDYAVVSYAVNRGLLSPDANRQFHPDARVTRAQFARVLATAFNWKVQAAAAPRFQDVPASHWARAAIETAAAHDVLDGYNDGNYYPDNPVTRAEALKALVLAAKWDLLTGQQSPFADVPLDHWAYPFVETAYRHGVIQLANSTNVRPKDFITRRELAAMLYYTLGDLAASGKLP